MKQTLWGSVKPYLAAAAAAAVSTTVAETIHQATHSTRLNSVFLAGILLVAYAYGSAPAIVAALFGIAGFFFVVQPAQPGVFVVNNLLTLAGTAALVGILVGRLRDAARLAGQREHAAMVLLRASREFAVAAEPDAVGKALTRYLDELGALDPVFGRSLEDICAETGILPGEALNGLARHPGTQTIAGWAVRDLVAGGARYGTAAWRSPWSGPSTKPVARRLPTDAGPFARDARDYAAILVDVAALALARGRPA